MDWSKGYTAKYSCFVVDPKLWNNRDSYEFISGNISRDYKSSLKESASIDVTELIEDGESWIRIYLEPIQNGIGDRYPLFTGLTSSPSRKLSGTFESWTIECHSVLKPAEDVMLPLGYFAPVGSGAEKIKELLSVSPAPIVIDNSVSGITENIVAEAGETNLSMAQKIMDVTGLTMRISGDGTVHIRSEDKISKKTFNMTTDDSIEIEVTDTYDWYSCPNVYRVTTEDGLTVTVRDDDPNSSLSTASRGREIWQAETGVNISTTETIVEYAYRRLRETQSPSRTISYSRRYYDDILIGDVITLDYPKYKLSGNYRIESQSIELGYACRTGEEVVRI